MRDAKDDYRRVAVQVVNTIAEARELSAGPEGRRHYEQMLGNDVETDYRFLVTKETGEQVVLPSTATAPDVIAAPGNE
jgi:hypothetical protein